METGNVKFIRGVYQLNESNVKSRIYDYELLLPQQPGSTIITKNVRIEFDNGFHDRSRNFDYWLYFRNDTNWKRCFKTGLAKTNYESLFEGNISKELNLKVKNYKGKNFETEQHLVLFVPLIGFKKLLIDVFENFYIHDKKLLKIFIDEHVSNHYSNKIIEL